MTRENEDTVTSGMPAPAAPENGAIRKRSAESGISRGRLRQRLEDQEKTVGDAYVDRSLSFGSGSSDGHTDGGDSQEHAS